MGQEFSASSNEQRYEQRYATKFSGYFYCLGIVGVISSWVGFLIREKLAVGMFRYYGVALFVVSSSLALFLLYMKGKHYHGVRITGATGTNSDLINGWYEPSEEMSGGMCVYVKVGDNDTCLEYNDKLKKWQVKPVDCKGKPNCRASCKVATKCLPEDCPVGEWMNGSIVQSTITIRRASAKEIETEAKKHGLQITEELSSDVALALKAKAAAARALELQAMKAAMSKPARPGSIRLAGVSGDTEMIVNGDTEMIVNGVYEPSNEITRIGDTIELPVYLKMGDAYTCMEYFLPRKEWQVKGTFSRGANICFASCVVVDSTSPCLPAECPKGKWKVDNGEKWVSQPEVTVTSM